MCIRDRIITCSLDGLLKSLKSISVFTVANVGFFDSSCANAGKIMKEIRNTKGILYFIYSTNGLSKSMITLATSGRRINSDGD